MNLIFIWIVRYHFYLDYEILLRIHLICPIFFFLYSSELERNRFALL